MGPNKGQHPSNHHLANQLISTIFAPISTLQTDPFSPFTMAFPRGRKDGARGQEDGARGREDGARGREDNARGREDNARGREDGARGREDGARSREGGVRGRRPRRFMPSQRRWGSGPGRGIHNLTLHNNGEPLQPIPRRRSFTQQPTPQQIQSSSSTSAVPGLSHGNTTRTVSGVASGKRI